MKRDKMFTAVMNYIEALPNKDIAIVIHHDAAELLQLIFELMDPSEVHKIERIAEYKFKYDMSSEEIADQLGDIAPEEVFKYERFIEELLSTVYISVITDYKDFLFQLQQSIFDMLSKSSAVIVVDGNADSSDTSDYEDLALIDTVMAELDKYRTTYKIGKVIKSTKPKNADDQMTLFGMFGQN